LDGAAISECGKDDVKPPLDARVVQVRHEALDLPAVRLMVSDCAMLVMKYRKGCVVESQRLKGRKQFEGMLGIGVHDLISPRPPNDRSSAARAAG
jgi:hypothetical protein